MEGSQLDKASEAGDNIFRVGSWASLSPEEMSVWLVGFTISYPGADHSERMAFAWGFFHAYQDRQAFLKRQAGGKIVPER